VPLCQPQIQHDLTRARTRAAAVGSRRLTTWAMEQPSLWIVWGMKFLSVHQLAVAACWYRCSIALFRVLIVQMTALTPHTTGRFFEASGKCNTAWDQSEPYTPLPWLQRLLSLNISWDFDDLGKVMRKRGRITVDVPSAGDRRIADICLTLIMSKPKSTIWVILSRSCERKVPYHSLPFTTPLPSLPTTACTHYILLFLYLSSNAPVIWNPITSAGAKRLELIQQKSSAISFNNLFSHVP
jgi:hypothetical protein